MEECVVTGWADVLTLAQLDLLSSYNPLITAAMLISFFRQPISGGLQKEMKVSVHCTKQIHLYNHPTPSIIKFTEKLNGQSLEDDVKEDKHNTS